MEPSTPTYVPMTRYDSSEGIEVNGEIESAASNCATSGDFTRGRESSAGGSKATEVNRKRDGEVAEM